MRKQKRKQRHHRDAKIKHHTNDPAITTESVVIPATLSDEQRRFNSGEKPVKPAEDDLHLYKYTGTITTIIIALASVVILFGFVAYLQSKTNLVDNMGERLIDILNLE